MTHKQFVIDNVIKLCQGSFQLDIKLIFLVDYGHKYIYFVQLIFFGGGVNAQTIVLRL